MNSAPYRLHDSLGYRLTYLARLNERGFEARLAADGLSRLEWCALCAVAYETLARPSEIAAFIGVDRAAVSRALRKLEGAGRISTRPGAGDGRSRTVSLTDEGRAVLDRATASARANAAEFAARLTAEERATLHAIAGRLMAEDRNPLKGL